MTTNHNVTLRNGWMINKYQNIKLVFHITIIIAVSRNIHFTQIFVYNYCKLPDDNLHMRYLT